MRLCESVGVKAVSRCLIGGMEGKGKIVMVGKIGKKVRLVPIILFFK